MRRLLIACGLCIATIVLIIDAGHAAIIQGRVVDSAGQPVARAEVRVWRKGLPPQEVRFDGERSLITDVNGRFATPDLFNAASPVRIVAQATGMMAEHSGWILPQQEVTEIEDIVLPRLRSIIGRVTDSHEVPIAGATIFNVDGQQRVETKTGSNGKFFLEGVPTGARLLFAEKSGYHFCGMLLGDDKSVQLRMVASDEPLEPLRTHDPVLTDAQRVALARRLLDPYLDAVSRQGNDTDKYWTLHELSAIDPTAALEWLERIGFADRERKRNCYGVIIMRWMQRKPADDWDRIFTAIEASDDKDWAAGNLIRGATYFLPLNDHDRRRRWLEKAIEHARAADDATGNRFFMAWAVEGFWRIGEREQARNLAREVELMLNESSAGAPLPDDVQGRMAQSLAPLDLPAALARLDQVTEDGQFAQDGAFMAFALAATDAAAADKVWNHIHQRAAKTPSSLEARDRNSADVCFRMARLDSKRAWRVASEIDSPFWRLRARAAVASAADSSEALKLIHEATAEDSLQQFSLAGEIVGMRHAVAIGVLSILPMAEAIDRSLARELFWRALSLRAPQPAVTWLDDEPMRADAELAQLVARYEPAIARALMQPVFDRLPQLASPAEPAQKAMPVVVAAAYIDPNWAIEALDRLPDPPDVSWSRHSKNATRMFLVRALALRGNEYWKHAGFWVPEE